MDPERILFIDGEALVIDKPAGLPVDPPRDGTISLENHLESLRFGFQRWPRAIPRRARDSSRRSRMGRSRNAIWRCWTGW